MASATVAKIGIGVDAAIAAVEAGARRATELGIPMSLAVVDDTGQLKAFVRQDYASASSVELAQDKAYTVVALGFGASTADLFATVKDDAPLLAGIAGRGRFTLIGGGVPIKANGAVIGAIGVSGGHYSDDMKVADAALAALGDLEQ